MIFIDFGCRAKSIDTEDGIGRKMSRLFIIRNPFSRPLHLKNSITSDENLFNGINRPKFLPGSIYNLVHGIPVILDALISRPDGYDRTSRTQQSLRVIVVTPNVFSGSFSQ